MDKKAAGTLTAADTELVRNLITSTSSGLRQAERLGVRYVSGSPNGAAALLTQLRADLEKLEAGAARTNSVAPSSAPTAPRATTTPVNVNINGSTRQINTASQQDAFALAEMLRQLDAMSTRATI
jgi:hypothetical protein